jgi:hypothetical protein
VVEHVEMIKIESTYLAALLSRMGFSLHGHAFYSATEPLYRRALEIHEKQLAPDHLDTAMSLNNLAELLRAGSMPLPSRSIAAPWRLMRKPMGQSIQKPR